jgi:hypothetical protein
MEMHLDCRLIERRNAGGSWKRNYLLRHLLAILCNCG